jgi:pyrroline-5-carboxylate reductase
MNVGIIGYGSMGRMLAENWLSLGLVASESLFVSTRTREKLASLTDVWPRVVTCGSNAEVAENADILFLCVKPAGIRDVLEGIPSCRAIRAGQHLVSINASVPMNLIAEVYGSGIVSKAIPSVTAEVHSSVSLLCHSDGVPSDKSAELERLFGAFGSVVCVPESELGLASELTSCMPGFIATLFGVFVERAALHSDLSRELMTAMVASTVAGTGKLLVERNLSFAETIARVATKGGITEEGTSVIDARFPAVVDELFDKTLEKRRRTTEKAVAQFNAAARS